MQKKQWPLSFSVFVNLVIYLCVYLCIYLYILCVYTVYLLLLVYIQTLTMNANLHPPGLLLCDWCAGGVADQDPFALLRMLLGYPLGPSISFGFPDFER